MAIPDVEERLRLPNRGLAWVVRRLQALVARIPDPLIRVDLVTMLEAHARNIERVEAQPSAVPGAGEDRCKAGCPAAIATHSSIADPHD